METRTSKTESLFPGAQGSLSRETKKKLGYRSLVKVRKEKCTYEVFRGFGNNIGTKLHDNTSGGGSADSDIKVNLRVGPLEVSMKQ